MTTVFCNSNYIDTVRFLNHSVYTYRSNYRNQQIYATKDLEITLYVTLVINF